MSRLLRIVLTRYRYVFITCKILLSQLEKNTFRFQIISKEKYRNSMALLRASRKYFNTSLTSFFRPGMLQVWGRSLRYKPNILTIKYVTFFLVLIISRVLTPIQIHY